jgi:N-acetyl-gamma-glutamyl-phosphate reductase common form
MSIQAAVLGASGYVGGELLRLIHLHPGFELAAAISGNNSGKPVAAIFPHLASALDDVRFLPPEDWMSDIESGSRLALFSAAPHGASAAAVADALNAAAARQIEVHVVDSSADFRYRDAQEFASIYNIDHPHPQLLDTFFCAVPEHTDGVPASHAGHPGCFATASLLASVPLVNAGLADGDLFISAVTGSTGSGRQPQPGTHHPERHSNLYAYKPLVHRHVPEIGNLIRQATGNDAQICFVPHSGPFARGIHVTLQVRTQKGLNTRDLRRVFDEYYSTAEFVRIVDGTPHLKNVVASNYADIGVAAHGEHAVVVCVIDNLVKGAAGGAVQWMNRLWSLPESTGLLATAPAWT